MNGASKLDREPVVAAAGLQGLIQAALALLVSFGVPLTSIQVTLITTVALGVCAYWVRGKVFSPVDSQGQPVTVAPAVSLSPNAAGPAVIDASRPVPIQAPLPTDDELSQMIAENEAFAKRLNAKK